MIDKVAKIRVGGLGRRWFSAARRRFQVKRRREANQTDKTTQI
jgi:hypothetical protein